MEEKESPASGSLGNSETDSPPQPLSNVAGGGGFSVPPPTSTVMNMNISPTNIDGSSAFSGGSGSVFDSFGKKKRGRPRKYDAEGNLRIPTYNGPPGFSLSSPPHSSSGLFSCSKRGRGKLPGSGNWQILASLGEVFFSTAGGDFTPHVVTVCTGEDVASKILFFAQKGPRGICILSANGAVSNVTIRQPGSAGGILTYEGRFEILSLSGSFTISDSGGIRSRTGGLSVSLAGPDGRVVGGGIAGSLTAASPIQIVVGSFMPNCFKAQKRKQQCAPSPISPPSNPPDAVISARPISQAAAPGGNNPHANPAFPLPEQGCGRADNSVGGNKFASSATAHSTSWGFSEPMTLQRPSPDINVSVLGE